jgi:hypothetical protein
VNVVLQEEGSRPTDPPKSALEALHILKDRKVVRVRTALKALRTASNEQKVEACRLMASWLKDVGPNIFDQVVRPFNNFLAACPESLKFDRLLWPFMFKWLNMKEFVEDEDCVRLLRQIFERFVRKDRDIHGFRNMWQSFLTVQQHLIQFGVVAGLIRTCVRRNEGAEKSHWEKFEGRFVVPLFCRTETLGQTALLQCGMRRPLPVPPHPLAWLSGMAMG